MENKDRASLIVKWKSVRDSGPDYRSHELKWMLEEYKKASTSSDFVADIYPVRAVSMLEVFTRAWASTMADHSVEFAQRAIPAIQNFKPDYSLMLSITGKTITFGDIVGYTIPVSNLQHILSIFTTLCGKDVVPLLKTAVDRWETEVKGQPPLPIIADYDSMCASVAALFELRHKICHEAPRPGKLNSSAIGEMLQAAIALTDSLEEILAYEMWGKVPLTQSAMNEAAYRDYKNAEAQLESVLTKLLGQYKKHGRRVELLNASQRAWLQFIKLQADFVHDPVGGGTIGPMLRAGEMRTLTNERREHLEPYVDNEYL
jgi:uncharacterized protein YecT (DUF1311 family)